MVSSKSMGFQCYFQGKLIFLSVLQPLYTSTNVNRILRFTDVVFYFCIRISVNKIRIYL